MAILQRGVIPEADSEGGHKGPAISEIMKTTDQMFYLRRGLAAFLILNAAPRAAQAKERQP